MTPKERAAMQQALEALELHLNGCGVAIATRIAYDALREALDHSGEANKMVGCAYCNNPLFAGTKCNNCGHITLAEQAEHEPVATIGNWGKVEWAEGVFPQLGAKLYTTTVRTKDLTDDDLNKLMDYWSESERSAYGGAWSADGEYVDMKSFARSVIAADREKNK